jgi:hypothetical protein
MQTMNVDESQLQLLIHMGIIREADQARAKQILDAFERLRKLSYERSSPCRWNGPRSALLDELNREIQHTDDHIALINSLVGDLRVLRNDANQVYFDRIDVGLNELRNCNDSIKHYLQQVQNSPRDSSAADIQSELAQALGELKKSVESTVNASTRPAG